MITYSVKITRSKCGSGILQHVDFLLMPEIVQALEDGKNVRFEFSANGSHSLAEVVNDSRPKA